MSLRMIRAAAQVEHDDDLHLVRLLLLMKQVEGDKRRPIDGIMKLAKLDFLLRYPNCLERALDDIGKKSEQAQVQEYERHSVETKMMRFRYGPWDKRYRRWIGLLVARDLAVTHLKGKTVFVSLTDRGMSVASGLEQIQDFGDYVNRSRLIAKSFGRENGTWMKKFIYRVFPEILDMKWGKDIEL